MDKQDSLQIPPTGVLTSGDYVTRINLVKTLLARRDTANALSNDTLCQSDGNLSEFFKRLRILQLPDDIVVAVMEAYVDTTSTDISSSSTQDSNTSKEKESESAEIEQVKKPTKSALRRRAHYDKIEEAHLEDGFCYLLMIRFTKRLLVKKMLGPRPGLLQFLALDAKLFDVEGLRSLGYSWISADLMHVSKDITGGRNVYSLMQRTLALFSPDRFPLVSRIGIDHSDGDILTATCTLGGTGSEEFVDSSDRYVGASHFCTRSISSRVPPIYMPSGRQLTRRDICDKIVRVISRAEGSPDFQLEGLSCHGLSFHEDFMSIVRGPVYVPGHTSVTEYVPETRVALLPPGSSVSVSGSDYIDIPVHTILMVERWVALSVRNVGDDFGFVDADFLQHFPWYNRWLEKESYRQGWRHANVIYMVTDLAIPLDRLKNSVIVSRVASTVYLLASERFPWDKAIFNIAFPATFLSGSSGIPVGDKFECLEEIGYPD